MERIDFTKCRRILAKAYNGANGKKIAVERVLRDENEMNARIFQFPTSAVKEQGRKIHYYDFLMEGQYEDCNKALLRIVPEIRMDMIRDFKKMFPISPICSAHFIRPISRQDGKNIFCPLMNRLQVKQKVVER